MDSNINVLLFVESRYKASRKKINERIKKVLKGQQIVGPVEISVAIVGDRKMKDLNKKYRQKEGTTNVLSFPLSEGEATILPKDVLRLGDVVISYPQAIKEAAEEEVMVDDKINELAEHGLLHLLGIHHEE